jgi:hypothetical protein
MTHRRALSNRLLGYTSWKQDWHEPGLGIWDYLRYRCDIDLAATFGTLFWPSFVEINGCIVLEERSSEEQVAQWLDHFAGDRMQTELMVNHTHVYDLFPGTGDEATDAALSAFLAHVLERTWACALREAYPEADFSIESHTDPLEYGPTITFYQRR